MASSFSSSSSFSSEILFWNDAPMKGAGGREKEKREREESPSLSLSLFESGEGGGGGGVDFQSSHPTE